MADSRFRFAVTLDGVPTRQFGEKRKTGLKDEPLCLRRGEDQESSRLCSVAASNSHADTPVDPAPLSLSFVHVGEAEAGVCAVARSILSSVQIGSGEYRVSEIRRSWRSRYSPSWGSDERLGSIGSGRQVIAIRSARA